ncbi:serine hydrolase [candidate division WOR-3 bacterium]|nr:serine hydrolase [candidate division WOR-3 bacterium]
MKKGVIVSLAILTVGCAAIDYWPTDGWRTSIPEEQGMDSEVLAGLIDYIEENELNIHSVTIIRHGYVVFDAYFWPFDSSTLHDIASCTKSVTSTLIGIALDKGLISNLNDPFIEYFHDYDLNVRDEDPEPITIRRLLTMTSGLECVNVPTEVTLMRMLESPDYVQFALDLPVTHLPGTYFDYNSCGSHLLGALVANSTGISEEEFCRKSLFEPLGIDTFFWQRDPQGYCHGWGDLRMNPHDMAKIGFLMLNKGRWDDRQIVSRKYVRQATRNHTKDFGPEDGYGYQWWTYKLGTYHADGRGGQRIFVAPILDLVIVTTAGNTAEESERYEEILGSFILPAIKKKGRGSLPANPQAFALLQDRIKDVARPPSPEPVPALPQIAHDVSGKTWLLDSNLVDWKTLELEFENGSDEAFVTLTVNDSENRFPVGLDGIPRITTGESFAADSRYAGQDVALKGFWSADTFTIDFSTLGVIERGTIAFHFTADSVGVELFEKTLIGAPVMFSGTLKGE